MHRFNSGDFFPLFVYKNISQNLNFFVVSNPITCFSIECQYENCAHLEVHCQPGVLIPNQVMEVDIVFYPREARRYHETIPFEINGLSTMNVEIFGEGTDMKVQMNVICSDF